MKPTLKKENTLSPPRLSPLTRLYSHTIACAPACLFLVAQPDDIRVVDGTRLATARGHLKSARFGWQKRPGAVVGELPIAVIATNETAIQQVVLVAHIVRKAKRVRG